MIAAVDSRKRAIQRFGTPLSIATLQPLAAQFSCQGTGTLVLPDEVDEILGKERKQ
jgi:hypothetical protein